MPASACSEYRISSNAIGWPRARRQMPGKEAYMSFDLMSYTPRGDKKNSDFFHEYLPMIYERRTSSGVADQVGSMRAIVIQVESTALFHTMVELYVMTPYRH
jgi:hypothetical protein